jgi:hypothetical protein
MQGKTSFGLNQSLASNPLFSVAAKKSEYNDGLPSLHAAAAKAHVLLSPVPVSVSLQRGGDGVGVGESATPLNEPPSPLTPSPHASATYSSNASSTPPSSATNSWRTNEGLEEGVAEQKFVPPVHGGDTPVAAAAVQRNDLDFFVVLRPMEEPATGAAGKIKRSREPLRSTSWFSSSTTAGREQKQEMSLRCVNQAHFEEWYNALRTSQANIAGFVGSGNVTMPVQSMEIFRSEWMEKVGAGRRFFTLDVAHGVLYWSRTEVQNTVLARDNFLVGYTKFLPLERVNIISRIRCVAAERVLRTRSGSDSGLEEGEFEAAEPSSLLHRQRSELLLVATPEEAVAQKKILRSLSDAAISSDHLFSVAQQQPPPPHQPRSRSNSLESTKLVADGVAPVRSLLQHRSEALSRKNSLVGAAAAVDHPSPSGAVVEKPLPMTFTRKNSITASTSTPPPPPPPSALQSSVAPILLTRRGASVSGPPKALALPIPPVDAPHSASSASSQGGSGEGGGRRSNASLEYSFISLPQSPKPTHYQNLHMEKEYDSVPKFNT